MSLENPWRVIHVSSNHEKQVAQHLSARSIEQYLPLYSERKRWTDRNVITERPLFSGYIFTRFPAQRRIEVVSLPGVLRVMGTEERDLVSHDEIERIRKGLANGLLIRPHPPITVGEYVRVLNGIFAGAQGMVRDLRHQQCCAVLSVGNTGQCFSLEVCLDDLEVLKKPVSAIYSPQSVTGGTHWASQSRVHH